MYVNVHYDVARIYTLSDPRNGAVRYVGVTVYPLAKRLGAHLRYKGNDHKSAWVQSLQNAGVTPVITEIDVVAIADRVEAEQRWIAAYREQGADLTNSTKGGVGCLGYRHTDEAKLKMSRVHKGRPSEKRGIPISDEQREKNRAASLRQYQENPGLRDEISRVHKGKTISEAQRKAVSEATKRRWQQWRESGQRVSDETRAKISAARKGKKMPPMSPETRARMAEAKRQWWAEKKAREAGGVDGTPGDPSDR